MNAKTINRLLMTVAVLVVFYGLALFAETRQTLPGVKVSVNTAGLKAIADRLTIKTNETSTTLVRRGDKWFSGNDPVAPAKIAGLLDALEKLKFIRVVASSGANPGQYGLSESQAKSLSIYKEKKLLLTLIFGQMATANSFFIRTDENNTVYEGAGDLVFEVSQPAADWTKPPPKIKK